MSTNAVGIDLGTTYSAIAKVNKHGVPEILHNAEGDRITPSVILFDESDIIIGNYAKQSAVAYPDQIVEFVKRHMGDDTYSFTYKDKTYSPEQLSSFILAKLKHDAEQRLGHPVEEAVITVPAYFGDLQRRATMKAGELAGLRVLKLLNEPTAAAFAYGLSNVGQDKKVLVFDLGGGTFDVTIVDIVGNDITVVATTGDHQLGGKDWDDLLIKHVAEEFKKKHGKDPLDDLAAYHDLRSKCVSAKISLTRRPKVNVFYDYDGMILRTEVTRELFEELSTGLMGRTEALAKDVLDDARIKPDDLDTVLLAGGSTRMPMVRDLIQRLFGKAPATDINPDECVALGAALTAALESARLTGEKPPIDIRTHDVTSHSLGMVAYKDDKLHNSRIITRNSRIPCERSRDSFVTTHDSQTVVDLWLVQGENPDPLECAVLGHFEFYGIPPRPARETKISVTYRYNANGIVEVEAMDLVTGQNLAHRLAGGQVTLDDVAHSRIPMQVALVMDCSGSMYGPPLQQAKTAARKFIDNFVAPNRQVAVVGVPEGLTLKATDDHQKLVEAIEQMVPIGGTPLHEGLSIAREALKGKAGVHRIYLVLSDGTTDDPDAALAESTRIRRNGGRIVAVGVGNRVQEDLLQQICSKPTDYHPVGQPIELGEALVNLATETADAP
jgi:molecular chaperone DnaK